MKSMRVIGLAVVAAFAFSATAAASASAETSVFDSTAPAKTKLTAKVKANQVFTTKAGKVICEALKVEAGAGSEVVFDNAVQEVNIKYEKCKAFGLAATISTAKYKFHAGTSLTASSSKGTVDVLAAITIKALGCTVTVPVQSGLGSIEFKTSGASVELVPSVTGITSSGTGTACTYASESKGTYEGASTASAAGGNVLVEELTKT